MNTFPLPDLTVSILDEDNTMVASSLSTLRGNKAMVLDFWHTKCTRCPAALEKLNAEAGDADGESVIFVSCALSQGEGNHDVAGSIVCDGSLDNMTHVYMDMEMKELAKAAFGFTAVPFYVIVDKSGTVIGSGEPKSVDYKKLISQAQIKAEVAAPIAPAQNTFTLDEDF